MPSVKLVAPLFALPALLIAGNTTSTTTLGASPNPSVYGRPVTLTATVTPSAATGAVTFFDGVAFLGTAKLSAGHATLTTMLLPSLAQRLRAYYAGDATYAPSTSATVTQTVNAVTGGEYQASVDHVLDGSLQSVAAADLNGDGKIDLVMSAAHLNVLLGNGGGSFQKPVSYGPGGLVVVADFNGDGVPDLAQTDGANVDVLLGTGNGAFGTPASFPTGISLSGIAVGDFNGDGKPDIVVTDLQGKVFVILGDGAGNFGPPLGSNAGNYTRGLTTGDFNGDGKTDLAVIDYTGDSINVLIGNGDGTFLPPLINQTGSGTWAVAAGDLNGDGVTDLAVVAGTSVVVLLGNGAGAFTTSGSYPTGDNSTAIAIGDWNGDGHADLAVLNGNLDTMGVFFGNGSGTFPPPIAVPAPGDYPYALAAGDFTGAGRIDLAVVDLGGDLDVMLNLPAATDLSVTVTHVANVLQGQNQGIQYYITVTNLGSIPTSGTITVSYPLPAGFTANFAFGDGWSCGAASPVTCTRSDPLAAFSSFPAITVLVTVAVGSPNSSTSTVSVSGGGDTNTSNNTASDFVATFSQAQVNTAWTDVPMPSGLTNSQAPLLLTDGSVMVQQYCSGTWFKLTPDAFGNYSSGTWTQLASMPSGYGPYAYSSAVLPDGRLVVEGGEYNATCDKVLEVSLGAVYDPKADAWTSIAPPNGWLQIGDSPNTVLPGGQFLLGASYNPGCCQFASLNPATLTWTLLPGTGKSDDNEEEGWTLLPDGSVLTVDIVTFLGSERYLSQSDTWVSAGAVPVELAALGEIGPQVLRPDGTVFVLGATGHTAIFNSATDTWSAGPDFPVSNGRLMNAADSNADLLPSGNVFFFAGGAAPNSYGIGAFEFDGTALHPVPARPGGGCSFLLPLPNGQSLCSGGTVELYTPTGSPNPAWAPAIGNAPNAVSAGQTYTISGTQFNGLSQAVGFGDDYQAATNYPLVRIVNTASGHVVYCRTHDHSTMAVATGSTPVSTHFDVPASIEAGPSTLVVVANGIPSQPVSLTVNGLEVTPANPTVGKGLTQQFTATLYSGGSATNVTASVTWNSATPAVATITSGGLATVVASSGASVITATMGALHPSTTLTAAPPLLQSIAVTPANPQAPKGLTQQFTATGTYTDNSTQNLTASVTWSSLTTATATIAPGGLAAAVALGTSTIQAVQGGVTGSTTLTVIAPLLQSIAVTPATPQTPKGLTQQFTATGTYSDNSTQNLTASVTWSSLTTATATIAPGGLATAVTFGTSTIQAVEGGITGSTVLTVIAPLLQSIAVTPANPTVMQGKTQQFTATATYSDGSKQDLTFTATWASGTTTVATIVSSGYATVVAASGTSSITATLGAVQGSTTLTAAPPPSLQSIAVTPANPSVPKGQSQQFTAIGTYSDNSTLNITGSVTWASGTTSVATITSGGLATAVASSGTSSITATLGTVQGSATLTAGPHLLQSVVVTPANPTVPQGRTQQFAATANFSDGAQQDFTGAVIWASATTSVATITSGGLATAIATSGTSNITATLGSLQGSATLTAGPPPVLQSIAVTPANPAVAKGLTQQFTATGTYSDSSTQNLTSSVTWASGSTAVATVTSGGLATAVAASGTSSITATLGAVQGSTTLTAAPPVLQSISVTPANPQVPKGLTQQFTATGTYSDSSTQNLTASVSWSSLTSVTATITSGGLATVVAAGGSSIITATLGAVQGSTALTATPPVMQSISVTPANPQVPKGLTRQFTATGTYSDSSTQTITATVTWSSLTPAAATITAGGRATAVALGASTIQAVQGSLTGATTLTVIAPSLQSIAVTPANPQVAKGLTQQLTATGTYSDGSMQNITASVTWASGTPTVASITSGGLATAAAASGTSNITATLGAVHGSTTLTATAPVLQSITVTPANPQVAKGQTQQFTAMGSYSDSSTQNITASVTWNSATPAVATVTSGGLATVVAASGTSNITATLGAVQGSTTLTVGAPSLQSIAITPANPQVAKGLTQQLTATGTYSDGSTQNITASVTWASGSPGVASINASGLATAVAAGNATIEAAQGSVAGTTTLTVGAPSLQSIAITPANPQVPKGLTQQLTATGTYSDGSMQNITASVTWASGSPGVASINASGLATAVAAGNATIEAAQGSVAGTTTLTVGAPSLQSIAITPANPSVPKGLTQQLTATGTYSDGSMQNITASVTWASGSPGVASINASGLATAVAAGNATIEAAQGSVAGTTTLTVGAPVLKSITVTPANSTIPTGATQQFTATGAFSDNSTQNISGSVTWASGTTSVATIASGGLATGASAGPTTVSATFGAVAGSTLLTVTPLGVCDVLVSGVYSLADVLQMINEALGASQPVNDLNSNTQVNVVDVQIVLNAAVGLGCTTSNTQAARAFTVNRR